MKKTLTTVIIAVIGIAVLYAVYVFGYKQGGNVNNTNVNSAQTEINCSVDQDCINKGVVCGSLGDQPTCVKGSLATGEEYPEPRCVCLNPNKEY